MNSKHRKLMDDLKAAKPKLPSDIDSWTETETAKHILAQILASDPAPEKPVARKRPLTTRRLIYGLMAVVLVGAATFLGVHFLGVNASQEVATHPTLTTSTTAIADGTVTTQQALQQIIDLIEATPSTGRGQDGPPLNEKNELVQAGRSLGLISASDTSSLQLTGAVTRRQFALWLWRGFGPLLPQGSITVEILDLGGLSSEEQQAVEGLVRVGAIQLSGDRAFEGDRVVTSSYETAVLSRVGSLVRGR